ncbi:hypothetical protein FQN54_008217 [Arachnomyces sp. PD_36]|nr:hypothetical protein FQN54_008217 [Arachnomyces sp. PD_36]
MTTTTTETAFRRFEEVENDDYSKSPKRTVSCPASPTNKPQTRHTHLVIYDQLQLKVNEDPKPIANQRMDEALESAQPAWERNGLVLGNQSGRSILGGFDDALSKLDSLQARMEIQDLQIKGLDQQYKEMDAQISRLNRQSDPYLTDRGRVINVYWRDSRGYEDEECARRIGLANNIVHEGDAATDAHLFNTGRRTEIFLFKEIYGVDPGTVKTLEENKMFDTIRVLNSRATRVLRAAALQHRKVDPPAPVERAFQDFVQVLEKDPKGDPLERDSDLGRVYTAFWDTNVQYYSRSTDDSVGG